MAVDELDQLPARLDLNVYRGDDFVLPFAITQGGSAVDISGWTMEAQVRRTADAASILTGITVTVTNGPGGLGELSVGAAALAALEGDCVWDFQRTTYPRRTLLGGKFAVGPDVTR